METREILLKADNVNVAFERIDGGKIRVNKVNVVFERIAGGKIRVTTSSWDDAKVLWPEPGARGRDHRQAGWARPRRQADRLSRHRRQRLVEAGYGPQA
jgi:hypothetical protein